MTYEGQWVERELRRCDVNVMGGSRLDRQGS